MYRSTLALILGLMLVQAAPVVAQQTLIDTTTDWDGSFTWGSLCPTGAFGQTFTIDSTTAVDSFSFFMMTTPEHDPECEPQFPGDYCPPPWDPIMFRAQLVEWDPVAFQAIGPVLYESSATYATSDAITEFVFDAGGVSLPPGTYVALLNAAGLSNLDGARGDIGIPPWYVGDPYNGGAWIDALPGGEWVFSQCTDEVDPTAYAWSEQGVDVDTAFTLTGTREPLCPSLIDGNANGIPDAVDAECPCIKPKRDYVACVAAAMGELVADECASGADERGAIDAAKHRSCR